MTDSVGQRASIEQLARRIALESIGLKGAKLEDRIAEVLRDAELARERDADWVSIKDSGLPKASGRYWCWWPKYFCGEVYFSSVAQEWWHTGFGGRKFEESVTHWRELPAPPACGS